MATDDKWIQKATKNMRKDKKDRNPVTGTRAARPQKPVTWT